MTEPSLEPKRTTQAMDLVLERSPEMSWTAKLVNRGEETVDVVLPADGSADGWRTPTIEWNVVADGELFAQRTGGGRCGNIKPMRSSLCAA